MDAQKRFKVPVTAIALDMVGCLFIGLGTLSLSGYEIAFLPIVSGDHNHGWTLVVFGVVFVTAATMLIIGVLLARRATGEQSSSAERRDR
ncbi:MAG: hypothetical protein J5I92_10355 [Thiogranum sp.]|nr:hypothetical protein [Thiogranum sp.]